jgi:hypothetical protein
MAPVAPAGFRLDGVETSIQRRGLAARIGWASLIALALPMLVAVLGRALIPAPLRHALGWLMIASPFTALVALGVRSFRWKRPGSIAVVDGDLVLERSGRDLTISQGSLVSGQLSPRRRSVTLTLVGGDLVHAHVGSVEDGQALLVAAGLDASRRTLGMRLGETFFLDFLTLALSPGVWGALTGPLGPSAIVVATALTVVCLFVVRAYLGPAHVVVGADGIIVQQSFASRFVPFGAIARIESGVRDRRGLTAAPSHPVVLVLTDGTEVHARTRHLMADQRAELVARIDDARRAWDEGRHAAAALAQLDRSGRSAAEWRRAVRSLLAAPESYRAQAVTRDALVEVLESPAAPPVRRLAAALALSGDVDVDARERIRIAAGACADDRLRVALRRAAECELDEDDLSWAEPPPQRRRA